jgi:hypothetical protein
LTVTAAEILAAIREAYPKCAVVREVSVNDAHEQAIYWRYQLDGPRGAWWAKHLTDMDGPIAEAVPEGWTPHTSIPVRRIDALLRDTSGYTAIEIKVTRADFKRDTEEKRRAWRDHTRRFIYAAPAGLLTASEMPAGCGLWEFDGRRLTVAKKATINKTPLPFPKAVFDTMLYRVSNYERAA